MRTEFFERVINKCGVKPQKKAKKPRRLSVRNVFIGVCMKQGNSMAQCSDNYKGLNENQIEEYQVLTNEQNAKRLGGE